MHREAEVVAAAAAGAQEPAADVAQAELRIDTGLRSQRHAVPAAGDGEASTTTAAGPAPVEQLELNASSSDGASGASWSELSADEFDAASAALELVAASPWWMLNVNDETPVVPLRSVLSEVTAARLEPQLWRLQVTMSDPKQNALLCMPACVQVNEGTPCGLKAAVSTCAAHTFSSARLHRHCRNAEPYGLRVCCRPQWDHRMAADITLNRRDWPIELTISARDSAAALATQDALLDVAYGRCVVSFKQQGLCATALGRRQ